MLVRKRSSSSVGDAGSWYYVLEPPEGMVAVLLFTMFAAVNQYPIPGLVLRRPRARHLVIPGL